MGLPQITVLNGLGAQATVNYLNDGRRAATDGASVVLSSEDLAAVQGMWPSVGGFLNASLDAAGTAQPLVAAVANRSFLLIVNTSADDLWFSDDPAQPAAVGTGTPLGPNSRAIAISGYGASRAYTIAGPNAGQTYHARWEVLV